MRPRCPKCHGNGLTPGHTITGVLEQIKCLHCGLHLFTAFQIRQPTAYERAGLSSLKGLTKSRRTPCLND